MNPLCACGCGREVSKPWHKWYHGHRGQAMRKLSAQDLLEVAALRKQGWSQKRVGEKFGVSQTTIAAIEWRDSYARPVGYETTNAAPVKRIEEIEHNRTIRKERKELWQAKRKLQEVRVWLRPRPAP
jgi:Helix-turn-helix